MIKHIKFRGEDVVIIIWGTVLVIIVFLISYIFITTKSASPTNQTGTPTPIAASVNPGTNESTQPVYNTTRQQKLLEKLKKRAPLSVNDSSAKSAILAQLPAGEKSGVLFATTDIIIDYTYTVDEFQVEILTDKLDQAKAEGNAWFRNQGLSQKAICNLPVSFYLNKEVADKITTPFDPLPSNCD